MIVDSLSFRLH